MTQSASIFLNRLTVIDHAYFDEEGRLRGGSVEPSFLVTGKVIGDEQVVVDFSTIKKDMKSAIDSLEDGLDHKLWNFSWSHGQNEVLVQLDSSVSGNLCIYTPHLELSIPQNAFRHIHQSRKNGAKFESWYESSVAAELELLLEQKLRALYPALELTVEVTSLDSIVGLTPSATVSAPVFFRYVHGLKSSTSVGCQNIAHGHKSYIQVETNGNPTMSEINAVLAGAAATLDNSVFVFAENLASHRQLHYQCPRGSFSFKLTPVSELKLVVLETETTVEHLINYVDANYGQRLRDLGVLRLSVSEGLTKGATLTYS